jgi:hypothetical protein
MLKSQFKVIVLTEQNFIIIDILIKLLSQKYKFTVDSLQQNQHIGQHSQLQKLFDRDFFSYGVVACTKSWLA